MRQRIQIVASVLAAAIFAGAAPRALADSGKVRLVGPSGKAGKPVKDDLLNILSESGEVDADTPSEKKPPRKKKKPLVTWIKARAAESDAPIVVEAEIVKKKLLVAVWSAAGKKAAEKRFAVGAKGKLAAKTKTALASWLKKTIAKAKRGADIAGALDEGGESESEDDDGDMPDGEAPEGGSRSPVAAKDEPESEPDPDLDKERAAERAASRRGASEDEPEDSEEEREAARPTEEESERGTASTTGRVVPRDEVEGAESSGKPGKGAGMYSSGEIALAYARVELGIVSRSLGFNDTPVVELRSHAISFMPTPGLAVEVHPLASSGGTLGSLGLLAHYRRSIGSNTSQRTNGPAHPTVYSNLHVGLGYRWLLSGTREGAALIPSLGWSVSTLELQAADDGSEETELPDVAYSGPKIGASFEMPRLTKFGLGALAELALIIVSSPGEIISPEYHRGGSVNGLVLGGGLTYALTDHMTLEGAINYHRYFFAFTPEPGDRFVAGGALDNVFDFRFSLRVAL